MKGDQTTVVAGADVSTRLQEVFHGLSSAVPRGKVEGRAPPVEESLVKFGGFWLDKIIISL